MYGSDQLGHSKTTKTIKIRRFRPNDDDIKRPSIFLGSASRVQLGFGLFVPARSIWKLINNILRDLEKGLINVEFLQFTFHDEMDFYDADLYEPRVLTKTEHLIWYRFANFRTWQQKGITRRVDFEYFSASNEAKDSFLIKIERRKSYNLFPRCRITVTIGRLLDDDGEPRQDALDLIVDDIHASGMVKDLSVLYEQLKAVEDSKNLAYIIRKNYGQVIGMKRWKYRRGILNVLHEIVTNIWEGPGWILQLKKKEYISNERRNFWKDLAMVIYQEVICPIYQYCTFLD